MRDLKPGEKGEIKAIFYSKNSSGRQSKSIYVHSNDPDDSVVKLTLQVNVRTPLIAVPNQLYFRELRLGYTELKKINLRNLEDSPLKIYSVTAEGDFLTVEIPNVHVQGSIELKPKSDLDVLVSAVLRDATPGNLYGKLIVKTDYQAHPTWTFPIYASVKSAISRIPRTYEKSRSHVPPSADNSQDTE